MYFKKSDVDFTLSQIDVNNLGVEVDENMLCFNPQDASTFQHNDDGNMVGILPDRDECVRWYAYTTSPNIEQGSVYIPINIRIILGRRFLHDRFPVYV